MQGTVRVRVPAVMPELCHIHPELILAKGADVLGSQLFTPMLDKEERRATEDGARSTREKPPTTVPVQTGVCQLSLLPPHPTSNK